MKKLFGIFVLILMVGHVMAQDVICPTIGSSVLSREGNKFYCDGEKMSRRDVQAYLKFNAEQDIYKQFRSGRQMYQAGWGLMGVGFSIEAAIISYTAWCWYDWAESYDPNDPTMDMGPGVMLFFGAATILPTFVLFQVPAIPLICVGKSKMRKSFDAYNISSPQTSFQPELRLQTNNNGVGLVCSF